MILIAWGMALTILRLAFKGYAQNSKVVGHIQTVLYGGVLEVIARIFMVNAETLALTMCATRVVSWGCVAAQITLLVLEADVKVQLA